MNTAAQEFLCRLISWEDSDRTFYLEKINESDFESEEHRKIFRAIKSVAQSGSKIDLFTVTNELEKTDEKDWVKELAEYSEKSVWPELKDSAKVLREQTIKRKILEMADSIKTGSVIEQIGKYQMILADLQREKIVTSSSDHFMKFLNNRESPKGYLTGFKKIDENTKCLKRGHFWIVGGYTNTGKTRFILQMIDRAQSQKAKVAFISLEMWGDDLMEIYLKIKMNRGMEEHVAANEIVTNSFEVLNSITNYYEIERYIMENDFDIVFIDYLQIIEAAGDDYERTTFLAHALARLAKKKNVCIVALSQVPEDFKKSKNFATLGFKGSGALASACDVGIILNRNFEEEGEHVDVPFQIILRKNRFGKTGMFTHSMNTNTGLISYDTYLGNS